MHQDDSVEVDVGKRANHDAEAVFKNEEAESTGRYLMTQWS